MKTILYLTLLLAPLGFCQEAKEPLVLMPWQPAVKEAPLFFAATAAVTARVGLADVTSEQQLALRVLQGRPDLLSLGLSGAGEVTAVTGEGLRDWSLRIDASGARFLDLRPVLPEAKDAKPPAEFKVLIKTRFAFVGGAGGAQALVLPTPGAATGLALELTITTDPGVALRVTKADGLLPVEPADAHKFVGSGAAAVELEVTPGGSGARGLELLDAHLSGKLAADGNSVAFSLTGQARAVAEGSAVELLDGVALASGVAGDGWHVVLRPVKDGSVYDLVAERAGDMPVVVEFDVPVTRKGDWRTLDFKLPAGVVVPLRLEGLGKGVEFNRGLAVVPESADGQWGGFLPASGAAVMAWRVADAVADGALFFSSTETSDVRVGSGLLRQLTLLDLRVLQGKLAELALTLDGPGEVLSVSGETVLGWAVKEDKGVRRLEVKLNQPIEGAGRLVIESQAALGGFPLRSAALRMAPVGVLRHSGWLRVANEGAVRIEISDAKGLIQLAPAQFPGGADAKLRQVFVYRFPAADYSYAIQADQVMPEVAVTETTVYELAETDRRVFSDIELDIREAPLREWELEIPADHAVAGVSGAAVADYVVASEAKDGMRRLKVIFKQAVAGRQLVSLRLEKNEAAKAGAWELAPLGFPAVKSRRGYVGAVAAAGYRLAAGKTAGVAEVPITFFPKKTSGLQQSFRLREGVWKVGLTVEALGQSVQADVFHLYSLKPGASYGSVLINYFVVGAPATEWKIAVPDGIGNIDVIGQNVGRDWRKEANTLIVPLLRPVLGPGTVLVTFEQPMNPQGGDLSPGELRPLGVQGERGYVQVVSPLQVDFAVTGSEGPLLVIDPSELPGEFRLLSSAPTLAAWQYTGRDFKIGTKIKWFAPGETAEQVVDFLKLTSQVSRDGEWVTDARIFVKSRGRNTLRMSLPETGVLWEAKVDGEPVNARQDGGETIVPLPARSDPKQAVEVAIRYGARSADPQRVDLAAPRLAAPVVIGEWVIRGDEGRQLVPRGGSAELVRPALAEDGYAWIARCGDGATGLCLLGLAALGLVVGTPGKVRRVLSLLCGLLLVVVALGLGVEALGSMRGNAKVLEYAAPVVAAGTEVAVHLGNVAPWRAMMGWATWLAAVLGLVVLLRGWLARDGWWKTCGLALIGAGTLTVHGGAPVFFLLVAAAAGLWWLPRMWQLCRTWRTPPVVQAAAVVLVLTCLAPAAARGAEIPGAKPAESMIHDWQIHDGRLRGTVDVTLRGQVGERFLLLRAPAVLSGFEGAGLRVVKAPLDGADAYFIVAGVAGRLTGKAVFEMPLADPVKGWTLPGGPAAMRQVTVRWDQPGWEFFSPNAARVKAIDGLAATASGAVLVLGPAEPVSIQARAKQRDVSAEETRFFAEVSNLFLPGPGVVNGRHRVAVRPAQGRLTALLMKVPAGFTVSDVVDGPVGSWRFDPGSRELRVAIEPAQAQAFGLTIETQRGAGALPIELELEPLRVAGAAGEIGFLGLAFGDEAQPERVDTDGLSRVNPEDFNGELLPRDKDAQPLVTLQHAFRYGSGEVKARVKVTAVAPELRAESWQLVSLGDDRLLVTTDLSITITRCGVFRLALEVPEGLEIESATGEGLSHWTESKTAGKRVVTLHLNGKTLGKRDFNLVLTGPPPGAQAAWVAPRLSVVDAARETGVLTVVPERGLQIRAVNRSNVSQTDPRDLVEMPKESARAASRPGALAYRLLQSDWALSLAIGKLDSWVTAQVYHEATLREGQMLSRVVLNYRIENAAVKALRVRIPGLDAAAAATVRASGAAVADLVAVDGQEGLWEIRFQRGVAGETRVELEYQRRSKEDGTEQLEPVVLEQVRQVYFIALRTAGRLELEAGTLPRGWQRADWAVVQSTLGQVAGTLAPLMAFRVADPEGPLPVVVKRLDLADLQRLRVASGSLTTLLAPGGEALTAVDLKMEVVGKGRLRLQLPPGAELFNVLVNDEGATLVREGAAWLFYVFPAPEAGTPATLRFVYSAGTGTATRLEGPVLNVPMENLTWRVLVPEGWHMAGQAGDFDLKQQSVLGAFRLEDYQIFSVSKRKSDSMRASAMLAQANSYLQQGDQEKASQALGNAVRSNQLDEAANEDARVLQYKTKTQQAVLGLNTRRQRVVLDNRLSAPAGDNAQFERAAAANPLMQGKQNFDPKKFDSLLEGNTADENAALKEIANRLVSQQLAAEPAPLALDVTLPERGTVLTFGRSVQVDGKRPMAIALKLKRDAGGFSWLALGLCLLVGALAGLRKKPPVGSGGLAAP
ncbi:MAG: hypothetical protein WCK77_01340 [Verrucomicrobiota bacterium]